MLMFGKEGCLPVDLSLLAPQWISHLLQPTVDHLRKNLKMAYEKAQVALVATGQGNKRGNSSLGSTAG